MYDVGAEEDNEDEHSPQGLIRHGSDIAQMLIGVIQEEKIGHRSHTSQDQDEGKGQKPEVPFAGLDYSQILVFHVILGEVIHEAASSLRIGSHNVWRYPADR